MNYRMGTGKNLSRTEIRDLKQANAAKLAAARTKRTTAQQLEKLDRAGYRAVKERRRLQRQR